MGVQNKYAEVDASTSSQILSALLLTLPACQKAIKLDYPNVRPAYVQVTEYIKSHFGISTSAISEEGSFNIQNNPYKILSTFPNRARLYQKLTSYFFALTVLHRWISRYKKYSNRAHTGRSAIY